MLNYLIFTIGFATGGFLMYKLMGVRLLDSDNKAKITLGNLRGDLTIQSSIFFFDIMGFDLVYIARDFGFLYLAMPELNYFKTQFKVTVTDIEQGIHYNFTVDPQKGEYIDSKGESGPIKSILDLTNIIANPDNQE